MPEPSRAETKAAEVNAKVKSELMQSITKWTFGLGFILISTMPLWIDGPEALLDEFSDPIERNKLTYVAPAESNGDTLLSMQRAPTPDETEAGHKALTKWRTADDDEKYRIIARLVVSKVLNGMKSQQVIDALEEPTHVLRDGRLMIIEYSTEEMYCAADRVLIIKCKDDRVSDVYMKKLERATAD